ncbi:MAG: hypothetical protein D6772_10850, partial [Bacteroidetes bacterium]
MRYFGLSIQEGHLPTDANPPIGAQWFGPRSLLSWLERHLGLGPAVEDRDYLRPEQYRQVLTVLLREHPAAFFARSFAADDLGTAAGLLAARDELLLAGWDFALSPQLPERLMLLAKAEALIAEPTNSLQLYAGEADRWAAVIRQAGRIPAFLPELQLCDEQTLLPPVFQRLFEALAQAGTKIHPLRPTTDLSTTDLGQWQAFLRGELSREKLQLRADGSLLLLRTLRETYLAAYLARLLRQNPGFRPAVLIPKPNRTLDNAFLREGLPSMGVASASLARPSLQ